MSTTVVLIAKQAFDDVDSAISGVVKDATLTKETTSYNETTGATTTTGIDYSCRVVFGNRSAIKDFFDSSEVGEGDRLVYIQALAVQAKKADKLVSGDLSLEITKTLNVAEADGFYIVVAK